MGSAPPIKIKIVIILNLALLLVQANGAFGNCASQSGCGGNAGRFRACPFEPGLEVTRGIAGHCAVGEAVIGDCISDEDCLLKKLGNVCCYSRCLGITQCHKYP